MRKNIKTALKASTIYSYHLTHPEDEFIQGVMEKMIPGNADAGSICYKSIIKNNRIDIIRGIIADMAEFELESLATAAVKENNKEVIELLYKNKLNPNFEVYNNNCDHFLVYAYKKGGFEIIKFMGDTGFCLNEAELFSYVLQKNDTDTLNYLIEIVPRSLDDIFEDILCSSFDIKSLVDFFIDKIDIIKHKDTILRYLSRRHSVDDVKLFINLTGITIDSNQPLMLACSRGNLILIEFYLQYGLQVDSEILKIALLSNDRNDNSRAVLDLLLKYDVDFSILNNDHEIDYEFVANLENHGLNRDIMLRPIFRRKN